MEINIEPEYECQICMDLLTEPVATVCGHTFCKMCLIRYLKTKLNCPMCRKPILQSTESLVKNVVLENIIKSKYRERYEERLKLSKLYLQEDDNDRSSDKRNNIPAVYLEDAFIWPGVTRVLTVSNLLFEGTIALSSMNDRLMVIVPNKNFKDNLSCLVEIQGINKTQQGIRLELKGMKRFLVSEFKNANENENVNIYF
jgi:hypothetical protein